MKGFLNFIREQGVVGFAVGFIVGGAVTKLVTAFVTDIINPFVGLGLGFAKNLDKAYIQIYSAKIAWGDFVSSLIDFLIIAFVVYLIIRLLGIKLEKKKQF